MASFNQVTLVGNVVRDIELKYIQDGTAVCNIGLAVNESYKTKSGEKKEDVLFIDCTAWGKTAEIANEYLAKGRQVLLAGKLKLDTWEKDGQKHSRIKMVVERLVMLGSKPQGDTQQEYRQPAPQQQQSPPQTRYEPDPGVNTEGDLPF